MRSRPRQDYIRTASNQSDDTLSSKPVLLVSNAGFGLSGSFFSHDSTQVQAEVEFNIQVLIALTHRFGKAMVTRGKGGIISVASNASFQLVAIHGDLRCNQGFRPPFQRGHPSPLQRLAGFIPGSRYKKSPTRGNGAFHRSVNNALRRSRLSCG